MSAVAAPRSWMALLALRRQWLAAMMLLPLHFAVLFELNEPWIQALLLAHLGIFLLWQPLWRGETQITAGALVFVAGACLAIIFWLNWWLVGLWFTMLASLTGSRVLTTTSRRSRLFHLAIITYLLVMLSLWVVPKMFGVPLQAEPTRTILWLAAPALLIGMVLMPLERDTVSSVQTVDFFYGVLVFMVILLLLLGSFAFMTIGRYAYMEALLRTAFVMAALLVVLAMLWHPKVGLALLQPVVMRYLLNIGTPFEQWLKGLAFAAETEETPARFLAAAVRSLGSLAWVEGVEWRSPDGQGGFGTTIRNEQVLRSGPLELKVCARYPLSPGLVIHLHLLTEIISLFYEAKRREEALKGITRMQAIYETGARLTHDIKNLLQSLYALASASEQPGDPQRFQELMRRQLPDLARRLELTLRKLREPVPAEDVPRTPAAPWWGGLQARYVGRGVQFNGEPATDALVPAELFDTAVENLLDNALRKRQWEPGIRIVVSLGSGAVPALLVCDSGSAVSEEKAGQLFQRPLDSSTGLGVGLYQVSKEAQRSGYRLRLETNRDGEVCFRLEPGEQGPAGGEAAG